MSTIERGVKRRCASCDTLFYDMLRFPIRCPKCGAEFDSTTKSKLVSVPRTPKARSARTNFSKSAKPAPTPLPKDAEADEETPEPAADEEAEADADLDDDVVDEVDDADTDSAADPAEDEDEATGDR